MFPSENRYCYQHDQKEYTQGYKFNITRKTPKGKVLTSKNISLATFHWLEMIEMRKSDCHDNIHN